MRACGSKKLRIAIFGRTEDGCFERSFWLVLARVLPCQICCSAAELQLLAASFCFNIKSGLCHRHPHLTTSGCAQT
jgi:hypothetical protein